MIKVSEKTSAEESFFACNHICLDVSARIFGVNGKNIILCCLHFDILALRS